MVTLLSTVTKMPGSSFGLVPRDTCPTGSRLRNDIKSICSSCYACKGRYVFPNVRNAQQKRYELTLEDAFVSTMVAALHREARLGRKYFRWHDSGDLYSVAYAQKIWDIVKQTPDIEHRLPTREVTLVKKMIAEYGIYQNLHIQISANYWDEPPVFVPEGCQGSMVYTKEPPKDVFVCPATTTRKTCDDCRACWESEHDLIAYHRH